MEVNVTQSRLGDAIRVTLRVDENSPHGDAALFHQAAQWCEENPDRVIEGVSFHTEFKPDRACLFLFMAGG